MVLWNIPNYTVYFLFFSLISLSDALPNILRLVVIRYVGGFACISLFLESVLMRLPGAEKLDGLVVWTVSGVETFSNLDMMLKSIGVILILLLEGVWSAWRNPSCLSFAQGTLLRRTSLAAGEVHQHRHFLSQSSKRFGFKKSPSSRIRVNPLVGLSWEASCPSSSSSPSGTGAVISGAEAPPSPALPKAAHSW